MIDFYKFEVLTFDCYGTLIDWESGILQALKPILAKYNINLNNNEILELYAELESEIEKGEFIKYSEVLKKVMRGLGNNLGFTPSSFEENCLVNSLKKWKPFPDTIESLKALKKKYRLAIISNIDDNLFALSAKHLKTEFDYVITAEQVKSYKPSLDNFKFAIKKINVSPEKILHIAQSIYHDVIPARALGLSAVWVNRRKGEEGFGATPPAAGQPDLEVPDLKTLVKLMGLE